MTEPPTTGESGALLPSRSRLGVAELGRRDARGALLQL